MHASLASQIPAVRELCRRFEVTKLDVFGSMARGRDFDPMASDGDFLVEFSATTTLYPLNQFFGFADALKALLGRPVDLVERGAVSNPFVLAEIDRGREPIYAA